MGSDPTFRSYYVLYHKELFRFMYSYVQCPQHAESLLQEVFVKLLENVSSVPKQQVKPWLYKTAGNIALNAIRSQKRRQNWYQRAKQKESLPMNYQAGQNPEQQMIELEEEREQLQKKERVQRAQQTLPERQALLLHLRYSGLKYDEIAAVLEVQPSSISQMLIRAKKAFQRAYEEISQQEATCRQGSAQ